MSTSATGNTWPLKNWSGYLRIARGRPRQLSVNSDASCGHMAAIDVISSFNTAVPVTSNRVSSGEKLSIGAV